MDFLWSWTWLFLKETSLSATLKSLGLLISLRGLMLFPLVLVIDLDLDLDLDFDLEFDLFLSSFISVYSLLLTFLMRSFSLWVDFVAVTFTVDFYLDFTFDFLREWEAEWSNRTGEVVSSLLRVSCRAAFFDWEGRNIYFYLSLWKSRGWVWL